jgi:hypothetical protein
MEHDRGGQGGCHEDKEELTVVDGLGEALRWGVHGTMQRQRGRLAWWRWPGQTWVDNEEGSVLAP